MSVTIKLSAPLKAHDEELGELTLREPTTEDVIELGQPFLVVPSGDGESGIEIRTKVVAKYVVKLAAIPLSSVKQLSLPDFSACQAAVMVFFGQSDGEEGKAAQS